MSIFKHIAPLVIVTLSALLASCNSCQTQKNTAIPEPYNQISPAFNQDSAFVFIQKQVDFGPRVPMTAEHKACGDFLAGKLASYGADVTEQTADMTHYDGQKITIRNILGSFQPEKETRVLLFAHWDTRPFADRENDKEKQLQPILGADDGGSGVGVLLEIARQIQLKSPEIGIDILFFDLEDWGQADFDEKQIPGEWWCVGSRYWSEHPHIPNYKAKYGILLDMVGASNATFTREGYSVQYASNIVEKIWSTASKLGYGQFFSGKAGGYITDDHVPVNEIRHIPSIDIINMKDDSNTGFASHWHTHNDNMNNINKTTLKAVGQTVMEVIYSETDASSK